MFDDRALMRAFQGDIDDESSQYNGRPDDTGDTWRSGSRRLVSGSPVRALTVRWEAENGSGRLHRTYDGRGTSSRN